MPFSIHVVSTGLMSGTVAIAQLGSMLIGAAVLMICSAEPKVKRSSKAPKREATEPHQLLRPKGKDSERHAAAIALEMLGKSTDEAIFLLDLGRATEQLDLWKQLLPRVRPHYAVKCNPEPALLKELKDGGCGFDCATKNEIEIALSMGVSADDIVFSHPCKLRSHLRYAAEKGVRLMSFDNASELVKISCECPQAKLLLRLVCDDSNAQCPMSQKFGAGRESWVSLLDLCAALKLNFAGVSFHVGSGCREPRSFEKALRDSREVFQEAHRRGYRPDVLDIGGGYPSCPSAFKSIAAVISEQLEAHFPQDSLRIIAEPGRFLAAGAGSLLTKVFAKSCQPGPLGSDGPCFRYYLNDGLYGSFNCVLYDHAEVIPELLEPRAPEATKRRCCIFGPTCDGFDVILQDHLMAELDEGSWLLWRNMGAYTSAAGSEFNGFPKAIVWPFRYI